jgi:predicted negative regulator of RcsB-dependent stress response
VRSEVRHQLKEDKFAATAGEAFGWLMQHRVNLIGGAVVAAILIGASLGIWYYQQQRELEASEAVGKALRTMNAPVLANYHDANTESYNSRQERAQAAEKQLQSVMSHYSRTRAAEQARYFDGLAKMDAGDNAGAEKELKAVTATRDVDLQSLAKMALAAVYGRSQRDPEAIKIYNDLIAHPTRTVSKATAQLELAALYEAKQPQEALKIYQELSKGDSARPASQIAKSKMTDLKP